MSASKSTHSGMFQFADMDGTLKSMQANMAKAMTVPQKMLEANLETGAELLSFMSRRMKSQSDLWSRIGHSHGIDETAEAQRKFVEGVTKDYADEMNQLAGIFRKNLETVTGAMSEQLSQAGLGRKVANG